MKLFIKSKPFDIKDSANVVRWVSDSPWSTFLFSSQFRFPLTEEDFKKYHSNAVSGHEFFSFFDESSGAHVGHCELKAISLHHLHGTIANVLISPEQRGKGAGKAMLQLMLKYAFEKLQLHRVGLAVHAVNERAIAAYRSIGFKVEGEIREVLKFENTYYSLLQMSVLKKEYSLSANDLPNNLQNRSCLSECP